MKFEEHVAHTEKLFGVSGKDIHRWIDAFYDREKIEKLSASNAVAFNPYDHRRHRHHKQALTDALKEFKDRYPPEVIKAVFEQHLRDDYDGYIPEKADFIDPDFLEHYHGRFSDSDNGQKDRIQKKLHMRDRIQFLFRFILPSFLVLLLVAVVISLVVIPFFRHQLLEQKKQTISELTLESWQIMDYWHQRSLDGDMSREKAIERAMGQLRGIRYGEDRKDYFWVIDQTPVMIMHPYLPELEGSDLSDYRDPDGKLLFMESVEAVRETGEGFVEYRWQWKDDSDRVVPKLSHVRLFESWDFIVGTGVYIEDVETEIHTITRRIVMVTILLLLMVSVIMIFLAAQSYRLEQRRREAVQSVLEAKLRYQALVESSEEGLILVLEGKRVYSNAVVTELLGYTKEEFGILELHEFLSDIGGKEMSGVERFRELMTGYYSSRDIRATLKKKTGELLQVRVSISTVEIGEKTGFLLTIRDISEHYQVQRKLDISENRIRILTENIGIGVFRIRLTSSIHIEEPNSACLDILGFRNAEELNEHGFLPLFIDEDEKQRLLKALRQGEFIRKQLVFLRRNDGASRAISLTMMPAKNEPELYDAIMEDLTTQREQEQQRHDLMDEIQSAVHSMNEPIGNFAKEAPTVSMDVSIEQGAEKMTRFESNSLFISADSGELIGIITDKDIRMRVLPAGLSGKEPVYKIMSAPVISISPSSNVFEAAMLMQKNKIHHLPIQKDGKTFVFSAEELLRLQRESHLFVLRQIEEAKNKTELEEYLSRYHRMVAAMVPGSVSAVTVCRFLSGGADAVARKIINLVLDELGNPPRPFCFIQMGSGGRQETTFVTDQDNALIWADAAEPEDAPDLEADTNDNEGIKEWFSEFGRQVSTLLNEFGYVFCKGENMVMNPRWLMPLSEWKTLFHHWITSPQSEEIIRLQIFFDFRCVYGESGLSNELRQFILDEAPKNPVFLWNLAQSCVDYKIPVDPFRSIRTSSDGDTFDSKNSIRLVVDVARLQSLAHGVREVNTLTRLHRLYEKGVLSSTQHRSASQVFENLSQLRLRHQYRLMENGYPPNNLIDSEELSDIDKDSLRHLLDQIRSMQHWIKRDYKGVS